MPYFWDDEAWEDYRYWQTQDARTLKKINDLLRDIARSGGKGIGQAELLKGNRRGLSSARIDGKNRLVYKVEGDIVRVVSCRGHYDDK